jgi:hypothetical protein
VHAKVAGGEAGLVEGREAAPKKHVNILVYAALELQLYPVDGWPLIGLLLQHLLQDRSQLFTAPNLTRVLLDRLLQIQAFFLSAHQLFIAHREAAVA